MLTVVIPAFNKAQVLGETLEGLSRQSLPVEAYEVIVVDDGSTDGTAGLAAGWTAPYRLRLLRQENQGGGAARNHGASQAQGEILLFLDADIIASPGLLAAHLQAQEACENRVCVGRVLPWARQPDNPIHHVFALSFDLGTQAGPVPFSAAITGNLSLRREAFRRTGGFNTVIRRGEDVEFGYRAKLGGLETYYQPAAVAYHNHVLSFPDLCEKARKDHEQLGSVLAQHLEFVADMPYLQDKLPIAWRRDPPGLIARKVGRAALAMKPVVGGMAWASLWLERRYPSPRLLKFLVWKVVGSYEREGLRAGMQKFGWRPPA